MKTCTKCKISKPLSGFPKDASKKDKLGSHCDSCNQEKANKWHKNNRLYSTDGQYRKNWRKLGIDLTRDEALVQLEKQNYACAICKDDLNEVPWHYDHNHSTLKLREILCSSCNHGLGKFNDDIHLLKLAVAYLEKHKNQSIN